MPSPIDFKALFNKNAVPYLGQPQLLYALLEVRPGEEAGQGRLPLNFSLVLDKSGSMTGSKIRRLREAVLWIIGQLEPADIVSLVAFSSSPEVLLPATTAGEPAAIEKRVEKLRASGGTKIGQALAAGLEQLEAYRGPQRVSRLILLTDGETYGDEEACRERADIAGRLQVPIVALGLGKDWNEELLEDLARRSGDLGYADLIKEPEDVAPIFEEVYRRMQVVARHLSLRLLLVQGVEARRVWQVTPLIKELSHRAIQGRAVVVDLEDLEEAGAAFLVELMIPGRRPGRYRLAQGELAYRQAGSATSGERERADLIVEITSDPTLARQVNGRVMNIVEKVTAHRLQTQALDEAAAGNIAGATQKLRAAHTRLLEQGEVELARTALEEAERLERGQELSSEGRKTIKLQSRKTVKLSDEDLPDSSGP